MENELPTSEQIDAALGTEEAEFNLTPEQAAIVADVLPLVVASANRKAEANKAKELAKQMELLISDNKKMIEEKLEEYRKQNTPLTPDELKTLISQEYVVFDFKMLGRREKLEREFTIAELPVKIEKKVLDVLRKLIAEFYPKLQAAEWSTTDSWVERFEKLIGMAPDALDKIADIIAICLDPYNEEKGITGEWVGDNLTTGKMLTVLRLQVEASRYRDFLSLVSQLIPQFQNQ